LHRRGAEFTEKQQDLFIFSLPSLRLCGESKVFSVDSVILPQDRALLEENDDVPRCERHRCACGASTPGVNALAFDSQIVAW
jgi:hypothetical protein